MFIIGITGGIGSGKTTVAKLLAEAGLPVISADKVSHAVTDVGGSAIPELAEVFGPDYIDDKGALKRQQTADLVFQDRKSLEMLNRIVHQHVLMQIESELERLETKGVQAVVLDVPIPVRHGFLDRCDVVYTVWTDDEIRLERLSKRGLARTEARRRIAAQMTREEYREIADGEIVNNGTVVELRQQIEELMQHELKQRGIRFKSLLSTVDDEGVSC
ncbi:MAG TPA: dephospho-CoA kinase [Clostridiaceae bacterium]|nr:dephospho-CoA kinase [Clostridiaceae bacterium]